jgi:hypothetical protein
MKIDVLSDFITDNMPTAIIEADDDGELIIHTQMRLAEKEDGLHVVPIDEPPPDNIIQLWEHPKFLAAHQGMKVVENSSPDFPDWNI